MRGVPLVRPATGPLMADNIFPLPETYGPMLRDYYDHLLRQPMSQQLEDLMAKLGAVSADRDIDRQSAAHALAQPAEPAPAGGEPQD